MLSKNANHAKWISFIILMLSVWIWFGQDHTGVKSGQQENSRGSSQLQVSLQPQPGDAAAASASASEEPAVKSASSAPVSSKPAGEAVPAQEAQMVSALSSGSQGQKAGFKRLPHKGQDVSKYKAVEVTATGYYAGIESTGKTPGHPEYGITYSGLKVTRDDKALSTIAADPSVFPIGTVLYIPGYGYGVVADTGSAIKGKRIDLYFETKDQVYREWGKRTLNVFVVRQGEGRMNEDLLHRLKNELLF